MRRIQSLMAAACLLCVGLISHVADAATLDLAAESVTFQQDSSGNWEVRAAYTVEAEDGTPEWVYSYTVRVYRNGVLLGTIGSDTIPVKHVDTSGCTTNCHGSCWIGATRGNCAWGITCGCNTGQGPVFGVVGIQGGDLVVLALTTAEDEYDSDNNIAQATFP
jgi:hypothetical protein